MFLFMSQIFKVGLNYKIMLTAKFSQSIYVIYCSRIGNHLSELQISRNPNTPGPNVFGQGTFYYIPNWLFIVSANNEIGCK